MEYIAGQDLQQIIRSRSIDYPSGGIVAPRFSARWRWVCTTPHQQRHCSPATFKPAELECSPMARGEGCSPRCGELQGDVRECTRRRRDGDGRFSWLPNFGTTRNTPPPIDLYALACTGPLVIRPVFAAFPFDGRRAMAGNAVAATKIKSHRHSLDWRAGIADRVWAILIQQQPGQSPPIRSEFRALEFANTSNRFVKRSRTARSKQKIPNARETDITLPQMSTACLMRTTQRCWITEEEQAHASNPKTKPESRRPTVGRETKVQPKTDPLTQIYGSCHARDDRDEWIDGSRISGRPQYADWQLRFDPTRRPARHPGLGLLSNCFGVGCTFRTHRRVDGMQFTREVRSFFDPRIGWKPVRGH